MKNLCTLVRLTEVKEGIVEELVSIPWRVHLLDEFLVLIVTVRISRLSIC